MTMPAVRRGDVEQLARLAAGYASRERFLTELTLDPPEATSDQPGPPLLDEDYLILSTIHSAKGQEWKSVHVLNVVDGCIPADVAQGARELEEERRLLYVAMTRARDHLHLLVPQRFYVTQQAARGDRHLYAGRTRFIHGRRRPALRAADLAAAARARAARAAAGRHHRPAEPHARGLALSAPPGPASCPFGLRGRIALLHAAWVCFQWRRPAAPPAAPVGYQIDSDVTNCI